MNDGTTKASRGQIIAAFASIYLVWGSTYLAIRYAVETIPPFIMGGARFLVSGALLYAWARYRGAPKPTRLHWRNAVIAGAFLLLGGNGAVVWAEQYVPSGLTALLVSILPFWLVIIEWARPPRRRPSGLVLGGLVLGFVGIIVLIGPGNIGGDGDIPLLGALVLILGSLSWAIGSFWSRDAKLPESGLLTTGMEMLGGGGLLLIVGVLSGELARLRHLSCLEGIHDWLALSDHLRITDRLHVVYLAARQGFAGETRDLRLRESDRGGAVGMGDRWGEPHGPHRCRRGNRDLRGGADYLGAECDVGSDWVILAC